MELKEFMHLVLSQRKGIWALDSAWGVWVRFLAPYIFVVLGALWLVFELILGDLR